MSTVPQNLRCENCAILVRELHGAQLIAPLSRENALSLLECVGEDPSDWQDFTLVWPRYRYDTDQPEFADGLPRQEMSLDQAVAACELYSAWAAVDLVQKRVLTSSAFPPIEWIWRDVAGANLMPDHVEQPSQPEHICVLPGWWELTPAASVGELSTDRRTPLELPTAHREVLWGPEMLRSLAESLVERARADQSWRDLSDDLFDDFARAAIIEMHRDWLNTSRSDLADRTPRECLHDGMRWIESLIQNQVPRLQDEHGLLEVPPQFSNFESAPPGTHEVIMYFHACREILATGWAWIREQAEALDDPALVDELQLALAACLASWLQQSFDEGAAPAKIIACERGRIPLVDTEEQHLIDCDCPICQMLAEGAFGPAITGYDGHELELDNEFTFSLCTTREEWEELYGAGAPSESPEPWGSESDERAATFGKAIVADDDDEFASPWRSTYISDQPIPDDPRGHWTAAFLLSEVVSTLKELGAPQTDIDRVNRTFRNFRQAETAESFAATGIEWVKTLEMLAMKYPDLIGRSADLQSRVLESLRSMAQDFRGDSDSL